MHFALQLPVGLWLLMFAQVMGRSIYGILAKIAPELRVRGVYPPEENHVCTWAPWRRLLLAYADKPQVYLFALLTGFVRWRTGGPPWAWTLGVAVVIACLWSKYVERPTKGVEWEDLADTALGVLVGKAVLGGTWL